MSSPGGETKTKKRKHNSSNTSHGHRIKNEGGSEGKTIEALDDFRKLRKTWPKDMPRLFDPELSEERRSDLWEIMCDGGDKLRRRYAWAIPDESALKIIKNFGPIVEIGSGLGYWAKLLRDRGVDINAYDIVAGEPPSPNSVSDGGSNGKDKSGRKNEKAAEKERGEVEDDDTTHVFWTKVDEGGPDALEEPCNEKRSLMLCYPDDFEGDEEESLGLRCLYSFEGDVVIHIGELFGDSISMTPSQTPWGRTTSSDCQEELASKFHCILKVPITRWPHSRDTLTVWKRHSFTPIHYDDDDSDEESGSDDSEIEDEKDGSDAQDKKKNKQDVGLSVEESSEKPDENSDESQGSGSKNASSSQGLENDTKTKRRKKDGAGQGKGTVKEKENKNRDIKRGQGKISNGGSVKPDKGGRKPASSMVSGSSDSEDEASPNEDQVAALLQGELNGEDDVKEMLMMSNMDIYAHVPASEELPWAIAAPSVQFLLEG